MTAPHDKLAGIKPGDRVRVTFEASVFDAERALTIQTDETNGLAFSPSLVASDTFQIERIEPPLKVGDRVKMAHLSSGPHLDGSVLAITRDKFAWVDWEGVFNPSTHVLSDLQRIA